MNAAVRALADVDTWVFDLDNTLYPAESALYDLLGERMTLYVAEICGLPYEEAFALQERYFHEYGATVVGLAAHHGVDAQEFLAQVHDVDLSQVMPDPELAALIGALPGRKYVFTNGGGGHGQRVCARLGVSEHLDGLFDIMDTGLCPKPQRAAYERIVAHFELTPVRAVLIEDTLRNLEPAHEMGFATVLVGPVHPEPRPPYVDFHARDVKTFLREALKA